DPPDAHEQTCPDRTRRAGGRCDRRMRHSYPDHHPRGRPRAGDRAARAGQAADVMVTSPHADSIAFESENGLDRYWTTRDTLRVELDPNFGDSLATDHYAARFQGELLSRLMKPA